MTCRVDSTLIAGACVVGDRGLGVLGSVIRSTTATGAHGAGYLYNDWASGDDGKEFRGLIVTPPASGTLVAYEDGSFDFTAPADGSYSFTYRLFVDGVDLGTAVASFTVGTGSSITAAVAATGTVTYTGTAAVAASIVSGSAVTAAVAAAGSITYTGTAAVVASVIDTPTISEPVTLAEAKQAARISGTALDDLLSGLITAARQMAEHETGRDFVRKTRRFSFEDWPAASDVLPVHMPSAVTVSYWGEGGWTTLAGGLFVAYESGPGTAVAPAVGTSWPTLAPIAGGPRVRLDVAAGPDDATTTDASTKLFIKACVAYWIDNPQAASATGVALPMHLGHLLDRQRLYY